MYILGWGLPWRLTTLPGALIPILPILLLALLPETPTWLLGKGRREEALTGHHRKSVWSTGELLRFRALRNITRPHPHPHDRST